MTWREYTQERPPPEMPVEAMPCDAYGTLLRNEHGRLIPQRLVADHGWSVSSHRLTAGRLRR